MTQQRMTKEQLAMFLPEWVRYICVNMHGELGLFSCKPHLDPSWTEDSGNVAWTSHLLYDPDGDWKDSLICIREPERWTPPKDGAYWSVAGGGRVIEYRWGCTAIDFERHEVGNVWGHRPKAVAYADACCVIAMQMHEDDGDSNA